jgi:hypothetical protein
MTARMRALELRLRRQVHLRRTGRDAAKLNLRENRADIYPGIDTSFGGSAGASAYAR